MADLGNTAVISPTDASNGSGTHPTWLGSAAPSTLDDAGRALQGAVAREWENRSYPTATGTAPAFVVTYTVAPAALRAGQTYTATAHAAAVGSDTLNANTLGAKNIKKIVAGVKTATAANDWYTGDKLAFVYDGTDMVWTNWQGPASSAASDTASGVVELATTTEVLTGADAVRSVTPDALAATWEKGADVASATTTAFGEGGYVHITGTTTITDLDFTTAKDGRGVKVQFDGILTLTHHATTLVLPGGANITTAAGDTAEFVQDASDNIKCLWYTRANGAPLVASLTTATEQASTSGTTINFTSIPATVSRITVMFDVVSVSGSDLLAVQIGDSGGLETSGYTGSCAYISEAGVADSQTADSTQFVLSALGNSSNTVSGSVTLNRQDAANTWVISGVLFVKAPSNDAMCMVAGVKQLSSTLDRLTIKTNGSNTFDAGSININYE